VEDGTVAINPPPGQRLVDYVGRVNAGLQA
jgi:hypothetical protein